MTDKAEKSWTEHAGEVAEQSFDVSDYERSSETSQGLAETHEQFSDVYASGTSDGVYRYESGDKRGDAGRTNQ